MNILMLRQLLLITHLTGLVLMAGTTVTEFVAFRVLIAQFKLNNKVPESLKKLMSSLTTVLITGGILLTLSGIGLTWISTGIYMHQLWLQLKLLLNVGLALNGMLVGSKQMKHLMNSLSENNIDSAKKIGGRIIKVTIFYRTQLLIFLVIVVLAVFKPI